MKDLRLVKINGHFYLKLDDEIGNRVNNGNLKISFQENQIKFTEDKDTIESYWNRAAKEFKRELFMNTIRPILKEIMGYSYTELECENKAKLLCQKYYEALDKGEKYEGPYIL